MQFLKKNFDLGDFFFLQKRKTGPIRKAKRRAGHTHEKVKPNIQNHFHDPAGPLKV